MQTGAPRAPCEAHGVTEDELFQEKARCGMLRARPVVDLM
jgi:hypothetical protein